MAAHKDGVLEGILPVRSARCETFRKVCGGKCSYWGIRHQVSDLQIYRMHPFEITGRYENKNSNGRENQWNQNFDVDVESISCFIGHLTMTHALTRKMDQDDAPKQASMRS